MYVDYLVLGAGISGLAYAQEKVRCNQQVIVCEAMDYAGGLCHSFEIDGFCFDSAVHLSFTTDLEARTFFDKTEYIRHMPLSYNYYHSYWLKHPIINNLYPLPINDKIRYIRSFIERNEQGACQNYNQWLRKSYGNEIVKDFHDIYTKKYWTFSPKELSCNWVGKRLNSPDLEKILLGAMTQDTGIDYYAKEMRYPKEGGYKRFLEPLLKGVTIQFCKRAIELNLEEKYVKFSDGSVYQYKTLISSIPLPELVSITKNVPTKIVTSASELKASKISLVSIGFNKESIPRYLWFYIYDEDIMAARVNSPSLKSRTNVPEKCSSLQFEIYHNPKEKIDRESILNNTKEALKKMKICLEEDIIFMDYRLIEYGNVIFDLGMENRRDKIKNYFNEKGVKLIGRFGEWDYLWSDQSYLSGLNCARNS